MSKPVITLRPYEDLLHQWLSDPEEALVYLNVALEDEDPRVFMLALRDVAKVQGGRGQGRGGRAGRNGTGRCRGWATRR